MTLSDDPWIKNNSIISPEKLHAVGMTAVYWNHCERLLLMIFARLLNLTYRVGWIVGHDIGDISLCEKIKEFLAIRQMEIPIAEQVQTALSIYDVCRQNRNTLSHFTVKPKSPEMLPDDFIFLRTKGVSAASHSIPSDLEDFRRVALETQVLSIHLWEIYKALGARQEGRPATWPPILSPPELLWKPPLPTTAKQRPRRPPSVPKLSAAQKRAKARKADRLKKKR
jgi:hypothetical protein